MHYLITGHTGFKGTWLVNMLKHQGHEVSGLALDPVADSLFIKSKTKDLLSNDIRVDIRDIEKVRKSKVERIYLSPADSSEKTVITCGTCNQKLRVPVGREIEIKCPTCGTSRIIKL